VFIRECQCQFGHVCRCVQRLPAGVVAADTLNG
jgi:hypothetical protein